jgi:hypothetical protein
MKILTSIIVLISIVSCHKSYEKEYTVTDFSKGLTISTNTTIEQASAPVSISFYLSGNINDTIIFLNNKISPSQLPLKLGPADYYGGYNFEAVLKPSNKVKGKLNVKVYVP